MGVTVAPRSDRDREKALTRQIARIDRKGVLLAGQTFSDSICLSELRRIEGRLALLDAARQRLLDERANLRRLRWKP